MLIGVLEVHLNLSGVTSLKAKRSIIKSLMGRINSRFNVSISEVNRQDSKSVAIIGLAIVSNDTRFLDQQIDTILNFMRNDGRFFLGQVEREIFSSAF